MSVFKKLAGQTAIYGLLTIVARFINFLLLPIHTKYLSVSDYGVIGDLYAILAFLMVILSYGMETTFFNFTRKKENIQSVFGTSITLLHITSIVFIVLAVVFKEDIAAFIDYPDQSQFIIYMMIVLAFDAMSAIPLAYFRRIEKIWKFTLIRVSGIIISVLLNVYLIAICPWLLNQHIHGWFVDFYNANQLIDYVFIANCVSSVWVYLLVLPTIFNIKITFNRSLAKKILHYTWPLLFVGMAGIVNETMDRTMLRRMLPNGEYETGIYNAFYKLSIVITLMIQAFRMGAEPFFFAHLESENKEKTYAIILKYFVYACISVFLITSLFAEPIARLLIRNDEFFNHPTGLLIVPILLLANVFLGMHYNLSIWYKAEGKTKKGAWISVFGAAITLVINFIFIPIYGILASAWATLACYGGMTVINYYWGQKYFKVPYPMKRISLIIFSAVALVFGFMYVKRTYDLGAFATHFTAALLVITYLATWFWIEKEEIKELI